MQSCGELRKSKFPPRQGRPSAPVSLRQRREPRLLLLGQRLGCGRRAATGEEDGGDAGEQGQGRGEPEKSRVELERGLQQNEVAVAGDEIGPHRGVASRPRRCVGGSRGGCRGRAGRRNRRSTGSGTPCSAVRWRAPGRAPRAPDPSSPRPAAPRARGSRGGEEDEKNDRRIERSAALPSIRPFGPPSPAGGRRDDRGSAPSRPSNRERAGAEGRRVRGSAPGKPCRIGLTPPLRRPSPRASAGRRRSAGAGRRATGRRRRPWRSRRAR